jgi:hypothetical protein
MNDLIFVCNENMVSLLWNISIEISLNDANEDEHSCCMSIEVSESKKEGLRDVRSL